uniref:UBX domain-containing protein n=1 Tax=Macrostomum lignano TaxID=282301 RepID=A0A1I8FE72_9PLAT
QYSSRATRREPAAARTAGSFATSERGKEGIVVGELMRRIGDGETEGKGVRLGAKDTQRRETDRWGNGISPRQRRRENSFESGERSEEADEGETAPAPLRIEWRPIEARNFSHYFISIVTIPGYLESNTKSACLSPTSRVATVCLIDPKAELSDRNAVAISAASAADVATAVSLLAAGFRRKYDYNWSNSSSATSKSDGISVLSVCWRRCREFGDFDSKSAATEDSAVDIDDNGSEVDYEELETVEPGADDNQEAAGASESVPIMHRFIFSKPSSNYTYESLLQTNTTRRKKSVDEASRDAGRAVASCRFSARLDEANGLLCLHSFQLSLRALEGKQAFNGHVQAFW